MYRTLMFVPGSQDKHLKKVKKLPADAVIFDLEDAVSHGKKEMARNKVKEYIQEIKNKFVFVRVNDLSTSFFLEDLRHIVHPNLTGIILPKTNNKDDIIIVDYLLE